MRSSKAPGICSISIDQLKLGHSAVEEWLVGLFSGVLEKQEVPPDWYKGIILPLWKGKRDCLLYSLHRGITLLSAIGKVFLQVLLDQVLPNLHSRCHKQQTGFTPGQSATEHIATICILIEKFKDFCKGWQLYIAFIDLKSAFDSVDWQVLWRKFHMH